MIRRPLAFQHSLAVLLCSLLLAGPVLPVLAQDADVIKREIEIDLKDAEEADEAEEDEYEEDAEDAEEECEGEEEPEEEPEDEQEEDDSCLFGCEDDLPISLNMLFNTGYSRYNLSDLNQVMQGKGYSAFSENLFSVGGSMQLVTWNFLTELEGNVAFGAPSINDTYYTNLSAGNVLLNFGYQLKPVKELSIYPIVGLGIGIAQLDFTRRNLLPSFDEFLTNPGRQGQISNLLFTLNAGVGIDWEWDWGGQIGIRGGYLWTPPSNWWDIQDVRDDDNSRSLAVAGGPSISLSGPYVRVMLGF